MKLKTIYKEASKNKLLVFVVFLAIFFRFYKFTNLQYFSDGEVLFYSILKQITNDHRLVLISPNQVMGINLGSILHWIVSPIFLIAKGNPIILGGVGSFVGVIVTFLVYKAGSLISKKAGLLSAGFYATSFMISMNDRRFWQLSFNSLFCIISYLAIFYLIKNKNLKVSAFIFAFTSIFAWHADLTLLTIPLFGLVSVVKFKIKLNKKHIPAILVILFSFLPLFAFELRHNFVNTKSFINTLNNQEKTRTPFFDNIKYIGNSLARTIFISPKNLSSNFKYAHEYEKPPFALTSLIILALVVFGYTKNKKKNIAKDLNDLYLATFFGGIIIYSVIYGGAYYDHYLVSIFPMIALFIGANLSFLHRKKIALISLVGIYVGINTYTLIKSEMSHPVKNKMKIVKKLSPKLEGKKFAAYDLDVKGAGFHYIYEYQGLYPVKSSAIDAWGWIYMSNSFLRVTPESSWPNTVVVLRSSDAKDIQDERIVSIDTYEDIQGIIIDNTSQKISNKNIYDFK
ncbi:hypothetical protein ACFL1M_03060 [Patescibacteria group bacterium]